MAWTTKSKLGNNVVVVFCLSNEFPKKTSLLRFVGVSTPGAVAACATPGVGVRTAGLGADPKLNPLGVSDHGVDVPSGLISNGIPSGVTKVTALLRTTQTIPARLRRSTISR